MHDSAHCCYFDDVVAAVLHFVGCFTSGAGVAPCAAAALPASVAVALCLHPRALILKAFKIFVRFVAIVYV